MLCDHFRQLLPDLGWTGEQRRQATDVLAHLNQCAACRQAIEEFEHVQDLLKPPPPEPEPIGGWEKFEDRLLKRAQSKRSPWLPQLMRLAAAFLLGIIAVEACRHLLNKRPGPTETIAAAPFTAQEVVNNVQAFDQVSQVFDRRASWLLLASEKSDLGLSAEPIGPARKILLLRLTMSHAGEAVSNSDLVIVPGQTASLKLPLKQGQTLHYEIGTSIGEPTRLSLWAELQTDRGGETIGALATQLQLQPNQRVSVGELVTSSGAYQLKVGFSQAVTGGSKL